MASALPPRVVERSLQVFGVLAEAEAHVHGTTVDKIHFHEVGAIDSIIDTVGTVLGLELLGVDRVYGSSKLGNAEIVAYLKGLWSLMWQ